MSSTSLTFTWLPVVSSRNSSPDRSSDTEPAILFRCQTNGFATLYKGVVMFEPGWRRSGGHCTILVTRYLLVSRVEHEVNNDLRSSLLGSDSISGLYKFRRRKFVGFRANIRPIENISCCLGVMSTIKESGSGSEKRFPSQQNSLDSVK
ncbi:hypothetical protein SCLCIDRAFT_675735 [Scleroderma citrinum Foug A]|uniref:Uncharacterized protein n=1 Tax=Scleroderma citrinum Foug A TaxID=1036808 RepID=A0A0C3E7G2_9AGAM|nr:hypothetical protein SCLCIDRAFT_675735 [Scleroderma citrinum Foug A]